MKRRPLGCFARLTWWPETCGSGRKNWAFVKISLSLLFLDRICDVFKTYFKVINNNKLMLCIVFWKVMSWILFFDLLFWCHKLIFRETSYGTVFGTNSRYWEQTLTIFDDVLLEETVHAQLGDHTRKSRKAWKNSVPWKKCHGMLFASAVSIRCIYICY